MTKFFDYLKQMLSGSKMLAKQTGYPAIYFFVDCLWSHLKYGCINRHYFFGGFWALRGVQRKDSLTYLRILKAFKRMNANQYVHLLERKEEFNNHFKDLINRDWIYIRDSSLDQLKTFIAKHDYMMVKPISACEGHGIRKVSSEEVNKIGVETVYDDWKTEDVIVEEVIQQHPRMIFGNESVNTIRMYSVFGGGKVKLLKALLRVGIGDTVVDNYGSGGVFYEVDIDSGCVISTGNSHEKKGIIEHPQSGGIIMLGFKIPNWDIVKKECERACRMIPQVRFVAWDIAITENGVEFIEGNENGDYELLEFTGSNLFWKTIKSYF